MLTSLLFRFQNSIHYNTLACVSICCLCCPLKAQMLREKNNNIVLVFFKNSINKNKTVFFFSSQLWETKVLQSKATEDFFRSSVHSPLITLQLPHGLPALQSTGWREPSKTFSVFRTNSWLVRIIDVLKVERASPLDDLIRWTRYILL